MVEVVWPRQRDQNVDVEKDRSPPRSSADIGGMAGNWRWSTWGKRSLVIDG